MQQTPPPPRSPRASAPVLACAHDERADDLSLLRLRAPAAGRQPPGDVQARRRGARGRRGRRGRRLQHHADDGRRPTTSSSGCSSGATCSPSAARSRRWCATATAATPRARSSRRCTRSSRPSTRARWCRATAGSLAARSGRRPAVRVASCVLLPARRANHPDRVTPPRAAPDSVRVTKKIPRREEGPWLPR